VKFWKKRKARWPLKKPGAWVEKKLLNLKVKPFTVKLAGRGGQKLKLIEEGKEHEKNRIYNKCSLFQVLF